MIETPQETTLPTTSLDPSPSPSQSVGEDGIRRNNRVVDDKEYQFPQLLPFDGIRPIYSPEFATASEAQPLLSDNELILGMEIEGQSKAYPITVLRFREMVNDELAGIPTLVTW
jgi:hypothetical protein